MTDLNKNSILETALTLGDWGWSLIPTKQNKKPACERWGQYQKQAADRAKLRRWFKRPIHGIAAVMGPASHGIVCRDFDQNAAYDEWAGLYPDLAETLPTAKTSRGFHVYTRVDPRQVAELPRDIIDLGDGEFRGGGYCVLPPSIHESGITYTWLKPPTNQLPTLDLAATGFVYRQVVTENRRVVTQDIQGTQDIQIQDLQGSHEVCAFKKKTHDLANDFSSVSPTVQDVIAACLPTDYGQRHKMVFKLAQGLKGIFIDVDPFDLEDHFREWHKRALPFIKTKEFFTSWDEFTEAWIAVQYPGEFMATLLKQARKHEVPESIISCDSPELELVAKWCRELQRATGCLPFFLGCRTIAEYLDITPMQGSRYLRFLVRRGLLEKVSPGDMKKKLATSYRYLGKL